MSPWITVLVTVTVVDLIFAALSIPLIRRRIPPNPLYGYRTRATLRNESLWYDANEHFGRRFLAGSLVSAVLALVLFAARPPEEFLPLAVIALVVPPLLATISTARYIRGKHQGRP